LIGSDREGLGLGIGLGIGLGLGIINRRSEPNTVQKLNSVYLGTP